MMNVVRMHDADALVSRIRAAASSTGRRAVLLVDWARDASEQERCAPDLGVSYRMLAKARRVLRDSELSGRVRDGSVSLDAAEEQLRARSTRSIGHEAIEVIARRIEATSSQVPRRALEIAQLERSGELMPRDVFSLAHRLSVNNTTLARARRAVAAGVGASVRSGQRSLTDASGGSRRPDSVETPVRVDASWVGREVSKKLVAALDAIAELPRAGDVAELLREHSNLTVDRLDRAVNWLEELRRAFR